MSINTPASKEICQIQWNNNRQTLLKNYWYLIQLLSNNKIQRSSNLAPFCQALIDYTAYGHFQLYPLLLSKLSYPPSIKKLITKLYHTTQCINQFNRLYEQQSMIWLNKKKSKHHLSNIGLTITLRLELEDKLYQFYKTRKVS